MKRRVLALDLGERRIGMAVSDELGFSAQGLPTWIRRNKREDLEAISKVIRERNVELVVVGNPLHLSGQQSRRSRQAAEFARGLEKHLNMKVDLWDERLTSREANRVLRESGVGIAKRKKAVDRISAVLILQSYLDFQTQKLAEKPPTP